MKIQRIAKQALCIMVYDLRYDHGPRNGHDAIRHQLLWEWCKEALGEQFDEELRALVSEMDSKNAIGFGLRVKLLIEHDAEVKP